MTQTCPRNLTIETLLVPVRFTMPLIVLPGEGYMAIIGQTTLREKLGIDVMAQLKASVLFACDRQDGAVVELTACPSGEPNAGAVLRMAMAVTAIGPGGDSSGDLDNNVTPELLSQRSMIFQDFEEGMQDCVGSLETAVYDAVDHDSSLECAEMLCDIVFSRVV